MLLPKTKYIRDKRHLKFIASLPCVITGKGECQACHIRSGNSGMGIKSSDSLTVPMNYVMHAKQHQMGSEEKFWQPYGGIEKARELANLLWVFTGQYDECVKLIVRFRNGKF